LQNSSLKRNKIKKQPCLAFVLSGGGARGALQVGALHALLEADIHPDLLVGTSIGAVNAAFLAIHGLTRQSLTELEAAWHDAAEADLLPANYLWLTVRILFNRINARPDHRLRDFFVAHGVSPDLRFGQIEGLRLILVATDLNAGCVVLYGTDPNQLVLEGVLASTALPPWVHPLEKDGRLLMDGGVVSDLPIEPAMTQGATEIVALDLTEPRPLDPEVHGFGPFLNRLMNTVGQRQINLELALARASGVPVHRIALRAKRPVPVWDFSHTDELIAQGYEIARREIAQWQPRRWARWRKWLARLWH